MAMSVGSPDGDEDSPISAINTTPLVDVMLVLLIIFLITIPVVNTAIPVTLPKERVELRESKPDNVIISIDAQGGLFWYEQRMPNVQALVDRLKQVAKQDPQPEVHIRGDLSAKYDGVGRALLAAQRAGITKVSFITEPPPRN